MKNELFEETKKKNDTIIYKLSNCLNIQNDDEKKVKVCVCFFLIPSLFILKNIINI